MKMLIIAISLVFAASANATSDNFESAVKNSKIISSLLAGVEAEYTVVCGDLNITADVKNNRFKAKTSCGGKDEFGDAYGVIVNISGRVAGHSADVERIKMQVVP